MHQTFPTCGALSLACGIALRWDKESVVHEKYNALKADGTRGAGGEYEPQTAFGWSNGVALKLMKEYREDIECGNIFCPTKMA